MKKRRTTLWITLILLGCSFLALSAPQNKNTSVVQQKAPVDLLMCPDINVISFKATLVSTEAGDPSIEFPHDKVRLAVILENDGNLPIPYLTDLKCILKRNNEVILNGGSLIYSFSAPGSREELKLGTDSFLHNVKTTYSFEIIASCRECRTNNNKASFTIDEAQLHNIRKFPPIPRRGH